MHTMTLLNASGDVTIGWDDANDDAILDFIQAKMDKGYSFFIIDKGKQRPVVNNLKDARLLLQQRKVIINDDQAAKLLEDGVAKLVNSSGSTFDATKGGRAKTAKEVASNNTAVTRPLQGG